MTVQQPEKFSLNQEIKKRKTQEMLRVIETRQTTRPSASRSSVSLQSATATAQVIEPKRTPAVATPARSAQTLSVSKPSYPRRQQELAIIGISALLIVAVCLGTAFLVRQASEILPTITVVPLLAASAQESVNSLVAAEIPVSNLRSLTVPDAAWNAQQGVQFDVLTGNDKGVFILLSYASPAQASIDLFRTSHAPRFKTWRTAQIANILLLSSPDTKQQLSTQVATHLTQMLVAPARQFMTMQRIVTSEDQ